MPVISAILVAVPPRLILVLPIVILLLASSALLTPFALIPTHPSVISKFALSKLAKPLAACIAAGVPVGAAGLFAALVWLFL